MTPDQAMQAVFVRGSLAALADLNDPSVLPDTINEWLRRWTDYFGPMDPIEEGWDLYGWEFRIYAISIFCVARRIGGSMFLRLQNIRSARRMVLRQMG